MYTIPEAGIKLTEIHIKTQVRGCKCRVNDNITATKKPDVNLPSIFDCTINEREAII